MFLTGILLLLCCFYVQHTNGKSYDKEVIHLPVQCPTFESWRLSRRCAYVYESKDCSGYTFVLNYNETVTPKPHQPNTVSFLLVRPGCEVGLRTGTGGIGVGWEIYEFPEPTAYESIDCKCRTADLKLLQCIPRRKLVPLGNCSESSASRDISCVYSVKPGVSKIGSKTPVDRAIEGIVMERTAFYTSFNGTDMVITVDDKQQWVGTAAGVLTIPNHPYKSVSNSTTLNPRETFAVWQVSYTCGGYQAFLAKAHLTIEADREGNIIDADSDRLKKVRGLSESMIQQ